MLYNIVSSSTMSLSMSKLVSKCETEIEKNKVLLFTVKQKMP